MTRWLFWVCAAPFIAVLALGIFFLLLVLSMLGDEELFSHAIEQVNKLQVWYEARIPAVLRTRRRR